MINENGLLNIFPTAEASGSIVSFENGADGIPMESLSVAVEPIQDLHGYDAPWPGGGNINRLPPNSTDGTETKNGLTITADNGVYTLSGTATAETTFDFSLLESFDLSPSTNKICFLNSAIYGSVLVGFVRSGTRIHYWSMIPANRVASDWSDTGNEVVDGIRIEIPNGTVFSTPLVISPVFMDKNSTSVTVFTPYSNICPITGRTGVDAFVAPNVSMWSKYKLYVDTGAASELMPVGKQITDTWENTNGTEVSFPWDVVHYTSGGDAFLKLHYAAPEALQFDAPEAIYYFDGTEAAGTYHIPIGSSYGTGWVVGHSIQFTLTAAPDEGDQLFIDCGTNNANNPADGRAWRVYDAGGTTVKQSGTTSEGTGGTSLGTIGNVNAHRTNGRLNAISRVVYGYARWSQSAMRQYYNSDADAGAWWTMQNPWDRPPTQAASLRGFLKGFSEDFLNHLEETEVVTALNTQEGFAEATETTLDKIFLPSLEQMYINPQLAGVEGESWDYYKELAEEAGLPGKFQTGQTYPILITYNASNTSSADYVFLRSSFRGYAYNEWNVNTSGYVGNISASYALRGCPSCKFKKSTPNGTRYNVDWTSTAGTVYGGTLDVVTGVLTVDRANIPSYNGETINEPWLSSMDAYVAGATPTTGAQVVYTLATPLTYQLTAQEITTLLGLNNVWSNAGDISLVYHTQADATPSSIDGLFINGEGLQADGWFLKWRKLAAPKPKTDYVSVWGRDGDIDLTESETDGQVFYENRELTMDMVYIGEDWTDAYSELLDMLHGKECAVQFSNDPYWYWAGRIIASLYEHKPHSLTMSGIMFPYKLSVAKVTRSATVSGAIESNGVDVVLPSSRMRVSPKVTVVAGTGESVTLKWGTKTQTLSAGTYYVRGLKVGSDDVTIKVWGTGTVTFEYRKGML